MPTTIVYDTDDKSKYHYETIPWGLPDPEWTSYGKFDCEITERLYDSSMEGWFNDTIGSCDDIGHFTRIVVDLDLILDLRLAHFKDFYLQGKGFPVGIVMGNDDRGFVWSNCYYSWEEFEQEWKDIGTVYRNFFKCEDCNGTGYQSRIVPNGTLSDPTASEVRYLTCETCEGEGTVYDG